jgi:predicted hydrolase (HD superfamily)
MPTITRQAAWALLTEFTQSESLRKHALAVEACMKAAARKYGSTPDYGRATAAPATPDHVGTRVATSGSDRVGTGALARPAERSDAHLSHTDALGDQENREGHEFTRADNADPLPSASAPEGLSEQDLWGIVGLIHDFDYDQYPSLEDHPYKGNEILKVRGWPENIRRAILSHAEYTGVTRDSAMEKALFACDELAGFITAVALIKPGKSLAEVDVKSVRKRMKDKAFARKVNRDDIINGAAFLGADLDEHIRFCIEALKPVARELGLEGECG